MFSKQTCGLILLIVLLNFGCARQTSLNKLYPDHLIVVDSFSRNHKTILQLVDSNNSHLSFYVRDKGFSMLWDLDSMGIDYMHPPVVEWMNNDFAAVKVAWSQMQTSFVFLPLRNELAFRHALTIASDSTTNNILILDTVTNDFAKFKVLNLSSGKTISFTSPRTREYPYIDSVAMNREEVSVHLGSKKVAFSVSSIY